jgi:hypothetical protein
MKILYLTLKRRWYDMIDSGEKLEEYRELKQYWEDRLGEDVNGRFHDAVEFRNGYHREARRMKFAIDEIVVGPGNPEWGAEPGKEYFVIKLGERITI